jgi:hypothetical protein
MTSEGTPTLAERAGLLSVTKRFPEERAALQRLFRESSSFQSLCEDYRDCLAALQQWEQSTSEDAPALAGAYAELLGELEQEVRQFLEDEMTSVGVRT